MSDPKTIDVLNRLLSAEYGSLIHRLSESGTFSTLASAGDHAVVQRTIADADSHVRRLAKLVYELRGVPAGRTYPTHTGSFHYLELTHILPQIIASLRELVRSYESSQTSDARANQLIADILSDHRHRLADLEKLHRSIPMPHTRN